MLKSKRIFIGFGALFILCCAVFAENVSEPELTKVINDAGKYQQQQQFDKVIELLEKKLPSN